MTKKRTVPVRSKKILFISLLVMVFFFLLFHGAKNPYASESGKAMKYPSKPIRIIIPAGAGGSLDREIRGIVPFLEKHLGISIIIENVVGADGIIAYNKIYKEKPDGYNIIYFNLSSAISLELTRETAKYVVKNLTPIVSWNVKNHALAVHADSWKTFAEFVNDAKQKKISLAATGGSANIQGLLLETALGIKFNWVPYSSSAEGMTAVAGKHVDALLTFAISPVPMIRAGRLRALAVFSSKPDPILPGVPNFKELGHMEVPLLVIYGMFAAPPNTPKEFIPILEKAISNSMAAPEFNKVAENIGITVDFKPSFELNKTILEFYELLNKYKEFIK
jgi:tripartite-type tricarboxylate transporter receptor subunit TctC